MPVIRVLNYLKRYPRLAILQLVCAVFGTLLVIVVPHQTRVIIDDVIRPGEADLLLPAVLIGLAAYFGQHFLNSLRIILNNTFEQKVIFDLRSDLYSKLQRLPLRWFDDQRSGDLMTRVAEDVPAMERVLIDGIEQGLVAVLQILIVATVMFYVNPALTWIVLIPMPFLALGAFLYTLTAKDRYRKVRRATADMNSLLSDNLSGIRQIKAYTMEEAQHTRFNKASERVRQATLRVMRAWAIYSPSMGFIGSLGVIIVLGFGGYAVLQGRLTEGAMVQFIMFIGLLYEPVGRLHQLNQIFQSGRAAAERVFAILDTDEESHMDKGKTLDPAAIRGHVIYDNVSFAYGELATISNVSLEARPGETIALVGATGAGKSTLINLLTRFYELDSGRITIDGLPIAEISKPSLRGAIGYVTQEAFLFNGTIRDNLLIARPDADEQTLWNALDVANASEFIKRCPNQLDTIVGERGIKLSVGERQRLSIARALLKNPPILLLDEATASVDTETERLIQEALERLMQNRTSFVIAHRLSTVRHADQIHVLEHGRVIESGTHDSLLKKKGAYAKLARTAFLVAKT